jgi:hypothetical protein
LRLSITYNPPSTERVLTPPCANAEMAHMRKTSVVEGCILTLTAPAIEPGWIKGRDIYIDTIDVVVNK